MTTSISSNTPDPINFENKGVQEDGRTKYTATIDGRKYTILTKKELC